MSICEIGVQNNCKGVSNESGLKDVSYDYMSLRYESSTINYAS